MLFRERRVANHSSWRNNPEGFRAAMRLFRSLAGLAVSGLLAVAADLEDCQKLYLKGEYSQCIRLASEAMTDRFTREDWSILLTRSHRELGHYPEAQTVISNALTRYSRSIPVRLLAHEVFLENGQTAQAKEVLQEINEIASSRRITAPDAPSYVVVGKAAMLLRCRRAARSGEFLQSSEESRPSIGRRISRRSTRLG